MPVTITDADEFTDPVQAPDDGDPASGATFQLAPQALANRTRYLKNVVEALPGGDNIWSGENFFTDYPVVAIGYVVSPAASVTKLIDPRRANVTLDASWAATGGFEFLESAGIQAEYRGDISDVLQSGQITAVSARVDPGAVQTGTNRMRMRLYRRTIAGVITQIGGEVYDDGTTNDQTLTLSGLTETIDRSTYTYFIQVQAGADGLSNPDRLYGLSVTNAVSELT